jgi:hypothetical protein
VKIARSAHRHGIEDEDILHALRLATAFAEVDDLVMWLGPGRDGQLLEIGVTEIAGDEWVVHAMPARRKYLR